MAFRILIVDDRIEDESDDISELPEILRSAGYEVTTEASVDAAYEKVWESGPDLLLLDINFPDGHRAGLELGRAIRENCHNIPIILITAMLTETKDVLDGFAEGADDYVTRPVDWRVVLARIRANLPPEEVDVDDQIRVDFAANLVRLRRDDRWEEARLQPLQFALLKLLVSRAGQAVPTTTIKERVWEKEISDEALRVCISRLRERLALDPEKPPCIETIPTLGYRFRGHVSQPGVRPRGR